MGWVSSFFFVFVPSNSGEIFVQCTLPPSLIVLRLVVRKLSCGQTHWQTTVCADFPTDVELADARPPRTAPASRRQRHPRLRHNGIVCCYVQRMAPWRTPHCQWGWLSSFSFFVPGDLDLWPLTPKFERGRDFCTLYLTAKFHHPTFKRSEVIVQTNSQIYSDRRRWKHPSRFVRYAGG